VFLEKFSQPTLVGRIAQADQALAQELLRVLEQVRTDSAVVLPETAQVDTIEARRSGSADYQALIAAMDAAITKAILGQTASVEGTPGKLGDEALRGEVRREIARADARLVMGSFTRQIARWLTEWNFPGAKTPIVRRDLADPEDLKARAERDRILFEMGFAPSEAYIRDTYGGDWRARAEASPAAFAEPNDPTHPAEAIADRATREAEPSVQRWLEQLAQMAEQASSLAELKEMALAAWPELDHATLAELIAKADLAAYLAGAADGQA